MLWVELFGEVGVAYTTAGIIVCIANYTCVKEVMVKCIVLFVFTKVQFLALMYGECNFFNGNL